MFAMLSSLLLAAVTAVTPNQTYFAKDMPVLITITEADGLLWLDPTGRVRDESDIDTGEIRLDDVFPSLWATKRLTYLQPTLAGEPTGPALVVEPLLSPRRATFDQAAVEINFQGSADTVNGLRLYPESLVKLTTTLGDMTFRMRPDQAPNTVWNFLDLVEGGFYNGTTFHRVVPDFILQGGDPLANSRGGPGRWIDYEESKLPHDFGVLSMGRRFDDPDSAGSQFFICLGRERTESLDNLFAAFGEMYDGADIIRALADVERIPNSEKPVDLPRIEKAELLPAPPRKAQTIDELLEGVPEEMREMVKDVIER